MNFDVQSSLYRLFMNIKSISVEPIVKQPKDYSQETYFHAQFFQLIKIVWHHISHRTYLFVPNVNINGHNATANSQL